MTPMSPTTSSTRASSRWTGDPGEFRPPRWASPQNRLPDGTPWPTAGRTVARWQERYLVHGEGDALGEPVRLPMFERYILNRMWEYDPATGRLAYDRILLVLPKGNDKTEQVGRIAVTDLVGPIAPVSPRIVIAAASYAQSREAFNATTLSIKGDGDEKAGPLYPFFRDGDHLLEDRILNPEGHGYIQRIAAVGGTNDGGKPTQFIGDELHEWLTERQRRVYIVQGKSIRKRRVVRRTPAALGLPAGVHLHGGMQIGITTVGASQDSLLGELYNHGVAVAKGEVIDPGFLFLCWEADPDWDLEDPEQLRQAILQANPAVGEFLPMENVIASYRDPTVSRAEFLRYNLGIWPDTLGEGLWMPSDLWSSCSGEVHLTATDPAYTCVRIGHGHQSAAIATAQIQGKNGRRIPLNKANEPVLGDGDRIVIEMRTFEADDGDMVSVEDIERELDDLRRRCPARVIGKIPVGTRGVERVRSARGPELTFGGAFTVGTKQRFRDQHGAIVRDVPSTPEALTPAAELLMQHVSRGTVVHDGDEETARQWANVTAKQKPKGWQPEAIDPSIPIVAPRAAMLALDRALNARRWKPSHVGGM